MLKVFRPNSRGAAGAVIPQPPHLPLDIIIHRYQLIQRERINVYGDVLPRGWYVVMQRDPLFRDPHDSESSRQQRAAGHDLVTPLHMVT